MGGRTGDRVNLIRTTDDDFRVCRIDMATLVELQRTAEEAGWPTRWTSVEALRSQVAVDEVVLQTFLRQRAADGRSTIRCFVLFAARGEDVSGGVVTLDVDPATVRLLDRVDTDPGVRSMMVRVLELATGGIAAVAKR